MRKRVLDQPSPVAGRSEEDVARAWEGTAGAAQLPLQNGATVGVRYPGRRNRGAGPDFLDAILTTPDGELRGAVEVHRRSSDWARHGHGADRRYAGVVLHVVGHDDGGGARPPGGAQLPLLEIGHCTAGGSASSFPCASAAGTGAAPDLVPALIAAGAARFAAAVARLRADARRHPSGVESPRTGISSDAWEQVAYEWIAAALGYARNEGAMRDLAVALPLAGVKTHFRPQRPALDRSADEAQALFLGSAGLLPSQRHLPTARRSGPTVAQLERAWRRHGQPPALRAYRWSAVQVRPDNSPLRRVLALAHLALAWPATGILGAVRHILSPPAQGPAAGLDGAERSSTAGRLARLVSVPCPDGYWATHWDFGVATDGAGASPRGGRPAPEMRTGADAQPHQPRQANGDSRRMRSPGAVQTGVQTGALIGASRAADVVVNVLLPLAAAAGEEQGDAALTAAAWAAFRAHSALTENWITRLMRQRTGLGRARGATAQQGLIALYEGPCRALRCGVCPLSGGQDDLGSHSDTS